jgi:hypothetical protein
MGVGGFENGAEEIVGAGMEGGGVTVYGQRGAGASGEAVWLFWQEFSGMYLDDNDDEAWHSSRSEDTADLGLACPSNLFDLFPTGVHPEFASWFRRTFEEEKRKRAGRAASRENRLLAEWERVIADAEKKHVPRGARASDKGTQNARAPTALRVRASL